MSVLSLDFGGSSVKYSLVDSDGNIGTVKSYPAPIDSREQATELVKRILSEYTEEVEGIAVSIPGFVDEDGTLVGSGAYSNLYGENISTLFSESCGLPVSVLNDGKSGALAETWNGALSSCKDGIVLIIGTAIAGGIIKDGKVHMGRDFAAGEFSYCLVKNEGLGMLDTLSYSSGMFGMTHRMCLKKNLNLNIQDSAPLLLDIDKSYRKIFPDAPKIENPIDIKADGKQMFKWLEEGDKDVIEVYEECIRGLAMTAVNLQTIYAPEKIAIGGGITRQKRVVEDIRREVDVIISSFPNIKPMKPDIVPCYYVAEPNIIGAARHFYLTKKV